MTPKIQSLLHLLDDEQALAEYLDENGYSEYVHSDHATVGGRYVLRRFLEHKSAAVLAFRLRDEVKDDPDGKWGQACEYVCGHYVDVAANGWDSTIIESEVLKDSPQTWIVAALIARELKGQA